MQGALEEYLNMILVNPGFFNLLIVKNFFSTGLKTLDIEASIPVDLSYNDEHFFEKSVGSFSRGTLINPINFV